MKLVVQEESDATTEHNSEIVQESFGTHIWNNIPHLDLTFTADGLIGAIVIIWLFWRHFVKEQIVNKLDGVFAPIEEERRLTNILVQIGVVTNASRVILTAFHNGAVDSQGYHLTKLSTINQYTAPGKRPMNVPIRDLPIGRIMYELEEMLKATDGQWTLIEYKDTLPDLCKDHLNRNDIKIMYNKLIKVGTLPIGILSLQYDSTERRQPIVNTNPQLQILEDLYLEIATIMRRRIVHPGVLKKLSLKIKAFFS
jgi:hypothetical protein